MTNPTASAPTTTSAPFEATPQPLPAGASAQRTVALVQAMSFTVSVNGQSSPPTASRSERRGSWTRVVAADGASWTVQYPVWKTVDSAGGKTRERAHALQGGIFDVSRAADGPFVCAKETTPEQFEVLARHHAEVGAIAPVARALAGPIVVGEQRTIPADVATSLISPYIKKVDCLDPVVVTYRGLIADSGPSRGLFELAFSVSGAPKPATHLALELSGWLALDASTGALTDLSLEGESVMSGTQTTPQGPREIAANGTARLDVSERPSS